ncbi:hypothetical protein [Streptomyces sp. NPDC020681]|uniref:hypothetical protein n=1 Tax=Streptomyces sp. NPDC020681 TaxID=3365083 RepID=UPI0037A52BBC
MANQTLRGRGVGSPARRSMTAAARAAARRTERAGTDADAPATGPAEPVVAGRTVHVEDEEPTASEAAEPDWEAPDWGDPDPADPLPAPLSASAGSEEAAAGRSHGRRRVLISAVLALAVVAGLAASTVLGLQYGDGRQAERARTQALAAAQKAAPVVLSYDYRHLERDFAAARGHLTGSFRDEYRKTTTAVVAPTATKYQGVVKATVVRPPGGGAPAASVVSASPERAVVLLFVNQVTRSTQVPGPRVDLNRVRMTLTLTSDGWKVSAVDAL